MLRVSRILVCALAAGAVCSASRADAAGPVVAVFGLDGSGSRLKQADLDQLTDFIGASLAESGRYQVVPREELKAALNRQKAASYKRCYAQSCQIEIGKELAAEKSLAGSVKRFGSNCIVTLRLFDLARATQEAAGTGTGGCGADAVLASLQTAIGKLTGRSKGGGGAVAVAPQVGGADYGEVEREARAAAAKAADEARARKAREQAAAMDWSKIQSWFTDETLDSERRAVVLEKFLTTFDRDNPHAAEAQAMLQKLRADRGMVEVPAGEFYMGCNARVDTDCESHEKPGKTEFVGTFRIDETEVTVAAYKDCVDAGACSASGLDTPYYNRAEQPDWAWACNWGKPGREDHPLNCVEWTKALDYCKWAGKRLPTEKEWEKAARGTDGRKYPWGNAGYGSTRVANIADEAAKRRQPGWAVAMGYDDGFYATAPVGSFLAEVSPYGAKDMIGNVWEWTADWYSQRETRSIRGGSWREAPQNARASLRSYPGDPAFRADGVGFRRAKSD